MHTVNCAYAPTCQNSSAAALAAVQWHGAVPIQSLGGQEFVQQTRAARTSMFLACCTLLSEALLKETSRLSLRECKRCRKRRSCFSTGVPSSCCNLCATPTMSFLRHSTQLEMTTVAQTAACFACWYSFNMQHKWQEMARPRSRCCSFCYVLSTAYVC